jgi:hypothetical protein
MPGVGVGEGAEVSAVVGKGWVFMLLHPAVMKPQAIKKKAIKGILINFISNLHSIG